jgi:hypothetical protein
VWLSDLPQDYERLDEFSDAVPNGMRTRRYRFADGSVRTFERHGASQWRETTPKTAHLDLSAMFLEPGEN